MDDWIKEGFRTEPILTIGKMLRRGIIAFEAPQEIRFDLAWCQGNAELENGLCGVCLGFVIAKLRRIRLTIIRCTFCPAWAQIVPMFRRDNVFVQEYQPTGWCEVAAGVCCPKCVCWNCEGSGAGTQNMDRIQCHVCNGRGTREAAEAYDRGF